MKKLFLALLIITFFSQSIIAEDSKGKIIFESKGCALCHKNDFDLIGPAIMTIATKYMGKEKDLIAYFRGQKNPIMEPERASIMKSQLLKVRTLKDAQMRELVIYILSSADRPH